jgi:ABC-type transporter Mla maintaining outer membrane lipid asymmetry ATPase subunit MlaF
MDMIKFQGVTKAFGKHTVLDNLNLGIPKGKVTFIIGKSGEGKSVTIKHTKRIPRSLDLDPGQRHGSGSARLVGG